MIAAAHRAFDGCVPAFLLKGMLLTSNNRECVGEFVEQHARSSTNAKPLAVEAELAELARLSALSAKAAAENERLAKVIEDAKQGTGTGGLALTIRLRQLMQKHGLTAANPAPLPLNPPIDAASIRLRGVAVSSGDLDLDHCRFARDCVWPELDPLKIRLLVSHDETRVAGSIDEISVDAFGRVMVIGTITDKAAMILPGLSISAAVERFSIHNEADRFGWFGSVDAVKDVSEISSSATPASRQCLILERWIPSAADLTHQEMLAQIRRVREAIVALQGKAA